MQPITIRTTADKFIVSIDKHRVDPEAFARFIEKLKLKILEKEDNLEESLDQLNLKTSHATKRFTAAQVFKSSAKSGLVTSKYDVYEQ